MTSRSSMMSGCACWTWAEGQADDDLFAALKALLIMGTATYDPAEDAILMPLLRPTGCCGVGQKPMTSRSSMMSGCACWTRLWCSLEYPVF
jgi:hypothetical protein